MLIIIFTQLDSYKNKQQKQIKQKLEEKEIIMQKAAKNLEEKQRKEN